MVWLELDEYTVPSAAPAAIPHKDFDQPVTCKKRRAFQTSITSSFGAAMWKYLGVVAAAILLGMVSPLLAAVRGGLLLAY